MAEGHVKFTEALITDEMLSEVRKFIGTKFRIGHSINNEEATRIAIQKFADGIGDTNPLWTDPEYAAKTRYGTIVARLHGSLASFRVSNTVSGGRRFHSGSTIEFYVPVLRNDTIKPR